MGRDKGIQRLLHDVADGGSAGQTVPGDIEILEKILGGFVADTVSRGASCEPLASAEPVPWVRLALRLIAADFAVGSTQLGRIGADIQIQAVRGRRVVGLVLATFALVLTAARKSGFIIRRLACQGWT